MPIRLLFKYAIACLFLLSTCFYTGNPATAQMIKTTIAGNPADYIGYNSLTGKLYTASSVSSTIQVFNSYSSSLSATVTTPQTGPLNIIINQNSNKIYSRHYMTGGVTVIDGATNAATFVPTGTNPSGIAFNTATNRLYVTNSGSNNVSVIDGNTNIILTTIAVGSNPQAVAVDTTRNRIYVSNATSNTISIIDGNSDTVISTPIAVGTYPYKIAVNESTNRIYVSNNGSNNVSIIDGSALNVAATVSTGVNPAFIAIDTMNNLAYVANSNSTFTSVIRGLDNSVYSIPYNASSFSVDQSSGIAYLAINSNPATLPIANGIDNSYTVFRPPLPVNEIVLDSSKKLAYLATSTGILVLDSNQYYLMTATYSPDSGSGTITTTPSGSIFPAGTVVTIAATPSPGSFLSGWSGACNGNISLTCKVTMDDAKSVTANFTTTAPSITTWSKSIGNPATDDNFKVVQQTSDGGYVMAGSYGYNGGVTQNFWVVKLSTDGTVTWQKSYNGRYDSFSLNGNEAVSSIQQTADGGYILAGSTQINSGSRGWILRLDAAGNPVWNKPIGSDDGSYSSFNSVQQTNDGGFIATGSANSNIWLVKFTNSGVIEWQKGTLSGTGISLVQTFDNGYLVAGGALLTKFAADGSVSWQSQLSGVTMTSVVQNRDGSYAVAGYSSIASSGGNDVWAARIDATGANILWQKNLGGTGNEYGNSLQQTVDGGYIIGGYSDALGAGAQDILLIKLDANGNLTGSNTYGGTSFESGASVQQTADGGFIVAGQTYVGTSLYKNDGWIMKLDGTGMMSGCEANAIMAQTLTVVDPGISPIQSFPASADVTNKSAATFSATQTDTSTTAFPTAVCVALSTINVAPTAYNFGTVPVGGFATWPVTISNSGTTQLNVSAITISGTDYSMDLNSGSNPCGSSPTLTANSFCTLSIKVAPTATGSLNGILTITSTDPVKPVITSNFSAVAIVLPSPNSISGTISYNGTHNGRIYITVDTNQGLMGTSITSPGPYTIHGLPNGTFPIKVFMDHLNIGTRVQTSPAGNGSVSVTSTGTTVPDIPLVDQAATAPPAPISVSASPGDSSVLIDWEKDRPNSIESADSYDIYWSSTADVSSSKYGGTRSGIPAGFDSPAVIDGLVNGDRLYFTVIASSGGLKSGSSPVFGPVTIGSQTGGSTISGTLNYTGPAPTGPLHIAVVNPMNKGAKGVYYSTIQTPGTSNSFTVTGVPDGEYAIYSIIDMNNDRLFGIGDVMTQNNNAPTVTVSGGPVNGLTLALGATNTDNSIRTDHHFAATAEYFSLEGEVSGQLKRPVTVTVTSATGNNSLLLPMDLGLETKDGNGRFRFWTGSPNRPNIGDSFSFSVTYSDGSSDTAVTAAVTGVNDSFPVNPQVSTPTTTVPAFSWSAPANPPAVYRYALWVWTNSSTGIWDAWDLPKTITSIIYGSTGSFAQPLQMDFTYNWNISSVDGNGNRATVSNSFTPLNPGIPTIVWKTPAAITYGSTLSASELNASTTIPGVFSYSPPAGTVLSAGIQTLTATFTPNDSTSYLPATATIDLTVLQQAQSISFAAAPPLTYGETITVTATATSSRAVLLTSLTPTVCTVSGTAVTAVGTGLCSVAADQSGDANYLAAPKTILNLTIPPASQTPLVVTGLPLSANFGQTGIIATTSGGSGTGTVIFDAGTSSACSIDPATGSLTISSGTGSCDITAIKAADTNYTAATSAAVSITINKAPQTISFTPPPTLVYGGATVTLSATATSGISPAFTSLTPMVCTVTGTTLTAIGTGICTISADQAGDGNYFAAAQIQGSVTTTATTFTITASSLGTAGTLSPPGTTTVNYGTTPTYTITPDPGYTIVDIRIDGRSTATTNNYTFSSINASHTIDAVFGPDGVIDPANITGKPQLADVLMVFTAALGDATLTSAQIKKVDCSPIKSGVPQPDGKIDHSDVVVMLRRVVGLEKW